MCTDSDSHLSEIRWAHHALFMNRKCFLAISCNRGALVAISSQVRSKWPERGPVAVRVGIPVYRGALCIPVDSSLMGEPIGERVYLQTNTQTCGNHQSHYAIVNDTKMVSLTIVLIIKSGSS